MELWNIERHHEAMLEYVKLKQSFYSTLNKLQNEHITPSDKRSLNKIADEISQNIAEFQEDNKYFLEYRLKPSNHVPTTNT